MILYSKNKTPLKRSTRLNYLSAKVLRSLYLIKLSPIHHSSEKKVFSRGSAIPNAYLNQEVVIHRGRGFNSRYVNQWMIGFKFGEFTWNRKPALYKAKQKKKKKKK